MNLPVPPLTQPTADLRDPPPAVGAGTSGGGMKLILNVESIVPPVTGIGRYTSEILGGLLARGLGKDLHCFSHFRWVDANRVINASSGLPAPNRGQAFPAVLALCL
jgi:hypothetical protein